MPCETRLREMGLFGLKKRQLWEDLAAVLQYLQEVTEKVEPGFSRRCMVRVKKTMVVH